VWQQVTLKLAISSVALAGVTIATACGSPAIPPTLSAPGNADVWVGVGDREVPGGDARQGRQAIRSYGCGACHVVPGVTGATGLVGPPLNAFAHRTYVAGNLPNTAPNLVRWIQAPQSVEPGTAMPNLGVDEADARHIAAYLYTLK
jgi:cytochrome c1